jgi:hypothetical protein
MSGERYSAASHDGSAVLDIGAGVGALLAHAAQDLAGDELEVSAADGATARIHTLVRERWVGGRRSFAALFPALPAGKYTLWCGDLRVAGPVTIVGGEVTETMVTTPSASASCPEVCPCPS